jgi:formylglycine-generating enzyme
MKMVLAAALCSIIVSASLGQEMVRVEGGTFMMGSNDTLDNLSSASSKPPHSVTVSAFSIGKYEVTYEKWIEVRAWGLMHGYNDLGEAQNGFEPVGNDNPATSMKWYDAVKWCNARSEKEGLTPVYYTDNSLATVYRTGQDTLIPDCMKWTANGYRLPTEAEWEFAARGGTKSMGYTYSGSNTPEGVAWVYTNSGRTTHPVGMKTPNELGLYDMTGNASEWVSDLAGAYSNDAQINPRGSNKRGAYRIGRGCSFNNLYTDRARISYSAGILSGDLAIRCVVSNQKLTITKPTPREVVLANSPYSVKWNGSGSDSMRIEYSLDDGVTYQEIAHNVPTAADSFAWSVPNVLSSKCRLMITTSGSSPDTAILLNFRIKGYVLTRFKANGDYEKFDQALHAWRFRNDSTDMWPNSWHSQFNYFFEKDPYTNQSYPFDFVAAPVRARSANFVDWPLFVRTFKPAVCYKDIAGAVYSPAAISLWAKFKDPTFEGSCFGFSQSCLLAFDRPGEFLQAYPEVGNFQNIHDLQLNDSLRQVVNLLYEHQFGYQHLFFANAQFFSHDVRATLEELKTYFVSDTVDHRSLSIDNGKSAHSIVPYRMEDNEGGHYSLFVYDNNYPSGAWPYGTSTYVLIDSSANSWSYPPLAWSQSEYGLTLADRASTYLSAPVLWVPAAKTPKYGSLGKIDDTTSYMTFYPGNSCSIEITNGAGAGIGSHGSVSYNTLDDGLVIHPQNSNVRPPLGYFVPEGRYSIQLSAFADSVADFSALSEVGMFNYWRSDVAGGQTDHLAYDSGIGVGNPDAATKTVNLEAITRVTGGERDFRILNCATVQNDSVRIVTPDSNRVAFVNLGPSKTYDLTVVLAGENATGKFLHGHIAVPTHSTHIIAPDWQDITHQPMRIYQDRGNTGVISDSLVVTNQVGEAGVGSTEGVPERFSLDQNYPNPFNPATVIRFGLPFASRVVLTVYDVLGREVAVLVDEKREAGSYEVTFNGASLSSGMYFYRMDAGSFTQTRKLMLLR